MNRYYLRKSNINTAIQSFAISVINLEQILFGKSNQHKYQNYLLTRSVGALWAPTLLIGNPSDLLTSPFVPFGRRNFLFWELDCHENAFCWIKDDDINASEGHLKFMACNSFQLQDLYPRSEELNLFQLDTLTE